MYLKVEAGYYVLISNGKAYKYARNGDRTEDVSFAINRLTPISLPVEVISVLSSGDVAEVAFFDRNDKMTRYSTPLKSIQIASNLVQAAGYQCCLRTKGKLEDVSYNQLLFIYRDRCNLDYKRLLQLEVEK